MRAKGDSGVSTNCGPIGERTGKRDWEKGEGRRDKIDNLHRLFPDTVVIEFALK